ncbi:PLC-like phosphodiesterase [Gautieria morchelliformis]|nr:PLC-like phosphodiesterase [Gautieria morchelliformis]
MQPSPANVGDADDSDIITSHLETAVNLTSYPFQGNLNIELSPDILQFLDAHGERPEDVISDRIIDVPAIDDSLPLTRYFISRVAPTTDSAGEPVVTHGHTFSQHISFRDVCVAIGNAVRPEAWPVMVSLECHLDVPDQDKIVEIMKEVWKEKLVQEHVDVGEGRELAPKDLRGRIVLMVEYYPPQSLHDAEMEMLEGEAENVAEPALKQARIGPSLASLGIYAHSVKPGKDWLAKDILEPPHILYNLSESAIGKLFTSSLQPLIKNSLVYLRRVYPKFSRIFSSNLVPVTHWRSGTQVAALNWQRYDKGVQINEAMFVGSEGWVPKPQHLLDDGTRESGSRTVLTCDIISACNVPVASANTKAYIRADLFLASGDQSVKSPSAPSSSPSASRGDYTWTTLFTWEFAEDDMPFVRYESSVPRSCLYELNGVYSISVFCSEYGRDTRLGTFCARVEYLRQGWKLVRLFDRKGKHNDGLVLARFSVEKRL